MEKQIKGQKVTHQNRLMERSRKRSLTIDDIPSPIEIDPASSLLELDSNTSSNIIDYFRLISDLSIHKL